MRKLFIVISLLLALHLRATAQNIGIGTTSPSSTLHLVGSMKIDTGKLIFANTGNSIFIGENAGLNDDLSDNKNVYIGKDAGKTGTTNRNSIAIGYAALYKANSDNNVAVGVDALRDATIAYQNVAIGNSASLLNISGNYNVAIGNDASRANLSGGKNTAIGHSAILYNNSGVRNVAVGFEAGLFNQGSSNVFLGSSAGSNEAGSDKLYIDNSSTSTPLIYGDFSTNKVTINDSLQSRFFKMTNGSANGYILQTDADGDASWVATSSAIAAGTGLSYTGNTLNSVWSVSGSDIYKNTNGNAGIGTSSPMAALHVVYGGANISENTPGFIIDNPSGSTQTSMQFWVDGTEKGRLRTDVGGNMYYAANGTGGHYFKGNGDLSDLVAITNDGKVGIGTISPSSLLHVSNSASANVTIQSVNSNAYLDINAGGSGMESSILAYTSGLRRWSFGKSITAESGSNVGSDFFINRYDDAGSFAGQPFLIKRSTGNIGIGSVSDPQQKLDVAGSINVSSANGYYIGNSKVLSVNGADNLFAGVSAGGSTTGTGNTFIGKIAGQSNAGGSDNTALGYGALNGLVSGNFNTALGGGAGLLSTGSNNVLVGYGAGALAGSNNIIIGFSAAGTESGSNKLYIDNSSTSSPLIYGDFSKDSMAVNGSLHIEGAMGLKVKTSQVAGTNNPNATGGIWIYSSGTGTIDLSGAAYTDRILIILNNTTGARTISSYRDLTNAAQTSIAQNASLWIVYDGTNWRQIK